MWRYTFAQLTSLYLHRDAKCATPSRSADLELSAAKLPQLRILNMSAWGVASLSLELPLLE